MALEAKTHVSKKARYTLLDRNLSILSVNNGFAYKDICVKISSSFTAGKSSLEYCPRIASLHIKTYLPKEAPYLLLDIKH